MAHSGARKLAIAIAFLVWQPAVAGAAEINVFCAFGMREVLEDLGPKFERSSGHRLVMAFANLGNIVKRVRGGGAPDVIIVPQQGIAGLVKDGKTNAGNVFALARGGIGVAVRKGAVRPDISTPDAFKRSLLAAKTITYLDPAGGGVSGTHVVKVLDRLGIAGEVKSKTILHKNSNEAAALVEAGKAELGINLIQELLPKPGVDLVGPLPGDLQLSIPYAAAIVTGSPNAAAAKSLVDFMRTPEAAAAIRLKGLEPG
jgi:molybdate transport system substrate-binding protein